MEENKKRMEWLDAMRGFTMILVVSYHVAQFGFGESEKISASLPFLVLFRMPLFFFVSGFLAYKATWIWTPQNFAALTWKKLKVQVLPALVFLCVFLVLKGKLPFAEGFMKCMHSPTKGGYWFTWVLLQMFLVYYLVSAFFQRWGKKVEHIAIFILWVASLVAYLSLYMPQEFGKWYKTDFMMYSSCYETLKFLHFFLMGNLVHRFWQGTQRLFDARWFFPVIVVLAFLCCADIFKWHYMKQEWTNLPKTLAMYTLMFTVVMFFRHYQQHFTQQHSIGKGLQYIGTRTLDIYLLHFILLPKMPQVGKWLDANHPNFVIDIVLSVSVALVVIAFCLLVSNILRMSPVLKEYLFGRPVTKEK
ncbi:MAG: acyltransferase [Bacteroidaceae bacterium]|nr:acyltransferase [Bacteroidaceae bacterium]